MLVAVSVFENLITVTAKAWFASVDLLCFTFILPVAIIQLSLDLIALFPSITATLLPQINLLLARE